MYLKKEESIWYIFCFEFGDGCNIGFMVVICCVFGCVINGGKKYKL